MKILPLELSETGIWYMMSWKLIVGPLFLEETVVGEIIQIFRLIPCPAGKEWMELLISASGVTIHTVKQQ